ncbi:unknown protein [Parachlamydia acanthamoebae UV-7]|uniref:Uncharacterized protein n=1 Tax=Parachlamydia acanthamoebae (strain UV7) TaxID=765952 RepID=F8L1E5_PARAV|nr:unknown protein [Parachlamydia acanthamoebae UV-7]
MWDKLGMLDRDKLMKTFHMDINLANKQGANLGEAK